MSGAPRSEQASPRISAEDRHIGLRLRLRRQMMGMTQNQLADLIDVTYQQVHKYEKGISRITAGQLHIIALVLGVDVAFFFENIGSHPIEADQQRHQRLLIELTRNVQHITKPEYRHAICDLVRELAGSSDRQPVKLVWAAPVENGR